MSEQITKLITHADEEETLTDHYETDAHTALTRGLMEFLKQIPWADLVAGRKNQALAFTKVEEDWPDVDSPRMTFPAAAVYTQQAGEYDDTDFTSKLIPLVCGGRRSLLKVSSELVQMITVDIWAGNRTQRQELVKILEDYFQPVDWMNGFRLELPHYFSAYATFLVHSIDYVDSEENSAKHWRMAQFQIEGRVSNIHRLGDRPLFKPKLDLTVSEDKEPRS